MKYSVVVPSKDKLSVYFAVDSILENSKFVEEVNILWDGDKDVFNEIDEYYADDPRVYLIENNDNLGVYGMFNYGVHYSSQELVLLINDDMYFPKNWDENLEELKKYHDLTNCVITFQVVEPGYVAVNESNIEVDFGKTIETFDVVGFNSFAEAYKVNRASFVRDLGWYMPVIISKHIFGKGYPTEQEFPHPNDITFFNELKSKSECDFIKIESCVYHLQRLSQRPKQQEVLLDKLNLCSGPDKMEGYLNVDKEDFDLSNGVIPYKDNVFKEVIFKHAVEHFRPSIAISILKEIQRILQPGGTLHIWCPDFELACMDFLRGANIYTNCAPAISRIYGQSTSEELVHKWGYTRKSMLELLTSIGFKNIELKPAKHQDEIYYTTTK